MQSQESRRVVTNWRLSPVLMVIPCVCFGQDTSEKPIDYSTTPYAEAADHDIAEWTTLIDDKNFTELDRIAHQLRTSNAKYRDGRGRLWRLYDTLSSLNDPRENDAEYRKRIRELEEWSKESPKSLTPRVALARTYFSWGMFARGGGFASDVSAQAARDLDDRSIKASAILDEIEQEVENPDGGYYRVRIDVSRGLSEPPNLAWVDAALKRDPFDLEATFGIVGCLLPRWFGKPRELERYARECARRTKDDVGMLQYTRMAVAACSWDHQMALDEHGFDWELVKKGAADWLRIYPHANEFCSEMAILAACADDYDTARTFAKRITDNPDLQYWDNLKDFKDWRDHLDPSVRTGDHERSIVATLSPLTSFSVSPEGRTAFTSTVDGYSRLIDLEAGKRQPAFILHQARPTGMSVHWKRHLLAAGIRGQDAWIMRDITGGAAIAARLESEALLLKFSEEADCLAIVEPGAKLTLFDFKSEERRELSPFRSGVNFMGLAFSSDGKLLAGVLSDRRLIVYDVETGEVRNAIKTGKARPKCVAWSPATTSIAIGHDGGFVSVLNWPEADSIASWKPVKASVNDLAFSGDGNSLAIALRVRDRSQKVTDPLRVWEFQSADEPRVLKGHQYGVQFVEYTAEDKLVSASFDWTVRVWGK